jgi:hypothetical protein
MADLAWEIPVSIRRRILIGQALYALGLCCAFSAPTGASFSSSPSTQLCRGTAPAGTFPLLTPAPTAFEPPLRFVESGHAPK